MKKILTIFMAITMLFSTLMMPSYAIQFSDLDTGHWAYNNIMILSNQGVISGYTDGTFRPEKKVTYAEFIKLMVCHLFPENKIISEVKDSHWATRYIRTAELFGGIGIGSIKEELYDKEIPRIEMIKFLGLLDKKVIGYHYLRSKKVEFNDIDNLSEEQLEYIDRAVNKGYIIGNPNGMLNPNSALSRAEMVTILSRI